MTKHFCDKCGTDTTKEYIRNVQLSGESSKALVIFTGTNFSSPIYCKSCFKTLEDLYNKWKLSYPAASNNMES